MKYEGWLKYPESTVTVQRVEGSYRCVEIDLKEQSGKRINDCSTTLELKFFLLSIPGSPRKEIMELIVLLNSKK